MGVTAVSNSLEVSIEVLVVEELVIEEPVTEELVTEELPTEGSTSSKPLSCTLSL